MGSLAIFFVFLIVGILAEILKAIQHIGEPPEERKARLMNERIRRARMQPWIALFIIVMVLGCILCLAYLEQVLKTM